MTQEIIDGLKSQIDNYKSGVDVLNSQLEANKEMFGECLNSNFQLRTQAKMFQKQIQDLTAKNSKLSDEIAKLLGEVNTLKVAAAPVVEPVAEAA